MGWFFICLVSSAAGLVGWWIGQIFGIAVALVLSMIFSAYGIHLGARWNRDYFGG